MAGGYGLQQAVKNFFDAYFTVKKMQAEEEERAYNRAFAERQYQFNLQKFLYDISKDEETKQQKAAEFEAEQKAKQWQQEKEKLDFLKNIQAAPKEYRGETFKADELKQIFPQVLGNINLDESNRYIVGNLPADKYEVVQNDLYTLIRDKYSGTEYKIPRKDKTTADTESKDLSKVADPISKMIEYIHLYDTTANPEKGTLKMTDPQGKEMEININYWDSLMRKLDTEARLKAGLDDETWGDIKSIIENAQTGIDITTKDRKNLNAQILNVLQALEQNGIPLTSAQKSYIIAHYKYRNRQSQLNRQKK